MERWGKIYFELSLNLRGDPVVHASHPVELGFARMGCGEGGLGCYHWPFFPVRPWGFGDSLGCLEACIYILRMKAVCFWGEGWREKVTPGSVQDLFLALHSGTTPDSVWGAKLGLAMCKAIFFTLDSVWSPILKF